MKVKIITLGCKVNQYESEAMLLMLEGYGFSLAEADEEADVFIVNSCTVTAESNRKVRQLLRRMRKENPTAVSVLTGCMPQAFPEEAEALPDTDIIIGTKNRAALPQHITSFLAARQRIIDITPHENGESFEQMQVKSFGERTRAFLKIQDGCNRFCSYCIIPYARGRLRSKPLEDIKTEVTELALAGYKEIVLTGINLPSYGQEMGLDLCDAAEVVNEIAGIERIRLGSLEPERLDAEHLARLEKLEKLCPQFHLSLQSGCDETLKRMNRHYTAAEYREIVRNIRRSFKNPSITTDVIVGFAGETDEEFQRSYDFVKEMGFAKVHVFPYSRRKGTAAFDMGNQLSNKVKTERSKIMRRLAHDLQQSFFESQIGRTEEVLFEQLSSGSPHTFEGYTMNYTPVFVESTVDVSGKIFQVEITSSEGEHCIGKLI